MGAQKFMGAQKLLWGHDASASLRHPQMAPGWHWADRPSDGDGERVAGCADDLLGVSVSYATSVVVL